MIRVQMIRSDTRHPDRGRRHQGWASCEVAGRHFEAQGSGADLQARHALVAPWPRWRGIRGLVRPLAHRQARRIGPTREGPELGATGEWRTQI